MKKWVTENAPWLVFLIMAFGGGLIAHIRAFEKAGIAWTVKQHFISITIKSSYAGFAGLMIYLLSDAAAGYGYAVSQPLAFVAAGIGGMFGAELMDFIFITGKDFVRKHLGLAPSPPTPMIITTPIRPPMVKPTPDSDFVEDDSVDGRKR